MPESQEEVPDSRNGHAECQELEQLDLRPITLDDIRANPDRERRDDSPIIEWKKRDHFLPAVLGKRKRVTKLHSEHNLWNRALSKVSSLGDTWENFDVEGVKTEHATRHRYKAVTCSWITDTVILKIETQSFNSGAMRRCFRTKKLSNFSHGEGWHKDSNNYVAKEYMVPVQRSTYFDDVKLQQEAKLWGEEFNRHNPPKKVDIMQMCVVEMSDRPDKPLYHLEHYIEGHYVKYNSNSGFVRDENLRLTPQAFSHFTFERSGHELVVVDVQGVGDLYTDPQIHTADGLSYGDGNLGTRGMALFFHSHVCNVICRGLGLTEFDLASTENKELSVQIQQQRRCKTVTRGLEEICASPREHAFDLHQYLRRRSSSSGCWSDVGDATSPGVEPSSPPPFHNESSDSTRDSFLSKRIRFVSESSTSSNEAGDRVRFQEIISNKQRPSNIEAELDRIGSVAAPSILGLIHFDLAKYHEVGRFLAADHRDEYDRAACLFHLERAVDCGVLPAIVTAADLYLGRPHDLLSDIQVDDTVENRRRGVSLLERAAEAGDRPSMVELARCCELGTYLQERRDWSQAVRWYERAVETESEETMESDEPAYLLLGKAAHLLRTGGQNLEPDFSRAAELYTAAAEQASAAMQGRIANKYFMAADECWALCDDGEEEE